ANIPLYANCRFPRPSGPDASYRLIENASGKPVMVFRLQDRDIGGCRSDRGPKIRERAEVRSAWLVKDRAYSLRFRAKFSNPSLRRWHSIFQIHQNDVNCVFLKMEMRPDGIELYYRDAATQRNNCVDGGDKRRRQIPIFRGRAYEGKWLDVCVDFTLSDKANGRIEVFLDGASRAVIDGANSLFSPYLKFGLYRIPKVKDGVSQPEGTATLDIEAVRLRPAKMAPGYPKK
ncbi:MAG: polysaccharide lyase, partial [Alphaproteobacteria bacterium]|nr:polysaccharide lyase [Alphaproteobacteria bacterium]